MKPAANAKKLAILIAEDDLLLAADLEDAIRGCGQACLGPASSLSEVLRLIDGGSVDAAILDVQLRHGERVYPAAELLATRGIPFAFVTAYGLADIDPRYAHCRALEKPVRREELELLVEELTGSPKPTPSHNVSATAR